MMGFYPDSVMETLVRMCVCVQFGGFLFSVKCFILMETSLYPQVRTPGIDVGGLDGHNH